MKIFSSLLLVAAIALAAGNPVRAMETDTCLCRNGIVSRGDVMPEVLKKCGAPTLKYQREETRVEKKAISIVTVDEWTYNFGPNEFMYSLRFDNGRVVRIESLDYGY